ncbi:MAG: bifunctional DNA-formamidopyrimidine glycosylase/DNA-(apurinic or apyrimidinic site) lyase [Eubacteriales bacterium]|nr:bifunctional DNA-formamidopyrimidine glycosylase/DNA-(apurinic or apyrimidinic site) lyase [Eubacteriales bacterium]
MPELPEVETVRRIIEPQIAGQTIVNAKILNAQVIAYPEPDEFAGLLTGQTVTSMSRRGKFLTIHFASGDRLTLHLRMTGQLLVTPADFPEAKHTHLICSMSVGREIRYIDTRRFGRFWYLKAGEADTVSGQAKLGLEPFDSRLTGEYLKKLGQRKIAVKALLLDQGVVAGIGNIYADEILYAAKLYPGDRCSDLPGEAWERLAAAIPAVMRWGIDVNEMTPEQYLAGMGKEYSNMSYFNAYGRAGKPCRRCGAAMERRRINGRSCCYCPNCQKPI